MINRSFAGVANGEFCGEHRTRGATYDVLRDAAHEKSRQAGVPMRTHHDEINRVFLGNPLDLSCGIALSEDVAHRQSALCRNVVSEVLLQSRTITGRLELRSSFAIGHIFGSERFDDVENNQLGIVLPCQIARYG